MSQWTYKPWSGKVLPSKATELLWMLVLREITSEIFIIWARLPLCFKMTILSSNKHQMHILFYVCICTGYIYDLFTLTEWNLQILTVCALKILGKILSGRCQSTVYKSMMSHSQPNQFMLTAKSVHTRSQITSYSQPNQFMPKLLEKHIVE